MKIGEVGQRQPQSGQRPGDKACRQGLCPEIAQLKQIKPGGPEKAQQDKIENCQPDAPQQLSLEEPLESVVPGLRVGVGLGLRVLRHKDGEAAPEQPQIPPPRLFIEIVELRVGPVGLVGGRLQVEP